MSRYARRGQPSAAQKQNNHTGLYTCFLQKHETLYRTAKHRRRLWVNITKSNREAVKFYGQKGVSHVSL